MSDALFTNYLVIFLIGNISFDGTDPPVSGHVTQNELWTPDAMLTYLSKVENLAEIFCIN